MGVNSGNQTSKKDQEAEVLARFITRLKQVLVVCRERPVVVFARTIDVLKGFLVLKASKTVVGSKKLELLHGQEVIVDGKCALLKDWRKLMLTRSNLIMLGLCRNTQFPELVIKLFHEVVDGWTNSAKVVLVKLLTLAWLATKEGAATKDKVRALLKVFLFDKEVLLLRTDVCYNARRLLAKKCKNAFSLFFKGNLGAK